MKSISPAAATRRSERAAAAILFVTGACLTLYTVVNLGPRVAELGSAIAPVAGNASMVLLIGGPLLSLAILGTLACARALWKGHPRAISYAFVWVVVAGFIAVQSVLGFGNVLWAIRIAILEPGRLLIHWPLAYYDPFLGSDVVGTPLEALSFGRMDDVAFWQPGVIAVAAVTVAVLLIAGRAQGTGRTSSRDRGLPDSGI